MNFNEKCKKVIATTILFVASFFYLHSQNIRKVEINILDSLNLNVKIYKPTKISNFYTYTFQKEIPNYYKKIDFLKNISHIKIHYKNDAFRELKKSDKFIVEKDFEYIEYNVSISKNKQKFLPISII